MDTFLWILQWLLFAVFLGAGAVKGLLPPERLLAVEQMGWVADTGIFRARMAGYAEIVGAFGLILPGPTGLPAYFVPVAALGLATIMGLAAVTVHRPRNEPIVPHAVLGGLALVVAIGRLIEPVS